MNLDLSYYDNLVDESFNTTDDYETAYNAWYWNNTLPVGNG